MRFHIPKRWAYMVIAGLALLAVAGAADSVESAMRDNYVADCDVYGDRFQLQPRAPGEDPPDNETDENEYTPPTPAEREQCREARLSVTVMSVITRATLGPGIAIIALTAVFLVSAAISAGRR